MEEYVSLHADLSGKCKETSVLSGAEPKGRIFVLQSDLGGRVRLEWIRMWMWSLYMSQKKTSILICIEKCGRNDVLGGRIEGMH